MAKDHAAVRCVFHFRCMLNCVVIRHTLSHLSVRFSCIFIHGPVFVSVAHSAYWLDSKSFVFEYLWKRTAFVLTPSWRFLLFYACTKHDKDRTLLVVSHKWIHWMENAWHGASGVQFSPRSVSFVIASLCSRTYCTRSDVSLFIPMFQFTINSNDHQNAGSNQSYCNNHMSAMHCALAQALA